MTIRQGLMVCGTVPDSEAFSFAAEHGFDFVEQEHLPVGLGKVDFDALTTAMRETDWSGTCTHELYSFDIEYAGHGKSIFDQLLSCE